MELLELNQLYVSFAMMLIIIVLLFWNIVLSTRTRKLNKRINRFTRGGQASNLEQVIHQFSDEMTDLKSLVNQHNTRIEELLRKTSSLKGNVGLVRYNAFGEQGSDLSYSIAIIDDKKNGVVITSIYNRGETNTYGKPVKEGNSTYKLSKEELEALEIAYQK